MSDTRATLSGSKVKKPNQTKQTNKKNPPQNKKPKQIKSNTRFYLHKVSGFGIIFHTLMQQLFL